MDKFYKNKRNINFFIAKCNFFVLIIKYKIKSPVGHFIMLGLAFLQHWLPQP